MSTTPVSGTYLFHLANGTFLSNREKSSTNNVSCPLGTVSSAYSWEQFRVAVNPADSSQVSIKSADSGKYMTVHSNVVCFTSSTAVWFTWKAAGGGTFQLCATNVSAASGWVNMNGQYGAVGAESQATIITPIRHGSASTVGELEIGQVALYTSESFGGDAWIFCQGYPDFTKISGLNDTACSIQLGPQTGATLWVNQLNGQVADFTAGAAKLSAAGFPEKAATAIEVWHLATPDHTLAEGELILYLQPNFQGPGRLINSLTGPMTNILRANNGSLRVGPNSAAVMNAGANWNGASQTCYADIASFADGLDLGGGGPHSLDVAVPAEVDYNHSWALGLFYPNVNVYSPGYISAQFGAGAAGNRPLALDLSLGAGAHLVLVAADASNERFRILTESPEPNTTNGQLELQPNAQNTLYFGVAAGGTTHAFTRIEEDDGSWSFTLNGLWVTPVVNNAGLYLQSDETQRQRFAPVKVPGSLDWVARLEPGEVAIYSQPNYRGSCFVVRERGHIPSATYSSLVNVGSVRLGPKTGASFYVTADSSDSAPIVLESSTSKLATGLQVVRPWTVLDAEYAPFEVLAILMQDPAANNQPTYRVTFTPGDLAVDSQIELAFGDLPAGSRVTFSCANRSYSVHPGVSTVLRVNPMGQVAINVPASDIHATPMRVRSPSMSLNEYVLIYPDEQIHRMLAQVDGSDFTDADKPLLPNYTADQANAVAASVRNCAYSITTGYRGDSSGRRNRPASPASVRLTPGTTNRVAAGLRSVRACPTPAWGLNFDTSGRPSYVEGTTATKSARTVASAVAPSGGQLFAPVGGSDWNLAWGSTSTLLAIQVNAPSEPAGGVAARSWIGDLWNKLVVTVEHVVQEAGKLVQKVVAFVLDTVSSVTQFLGALLQKIGAAMTQVVNWLSALFDWGDILNTKNALYEIVENRLGQLKNGAAALEDRILTDINNAQNKFDQFLQNVEQYLLQHPVGPVFEANAGNTSEADESRVQGEWLLATTSEQAAASTPGAGQPTQSSFTDALTTLFSNLESAFTDNQKASAALEAAKSDLQAAAQDFLNGNFLQAARDFLAAIVAFARAISDVFFSVATALVQGVFDFAQAAFDGLYAWLVQPISIPVISNLYQSHVGKPLSLLDLGMLIAAVPATIGYKLLNDNQPPFPAVATRTNLPTFSPRTLALISGCVSLFRALTDTAVDIVIISNENAGIPTSTTTEKVISGILLVIGAVVTATGMPSDGNADHSTVLFWQQSTFADQIAAFMWDYQWICLAIQAGCMLLPEPRPNPTDQYTPRFRLTRASAPVIDFFLAVVNVGLSAHLVLTEYTEAPNGHYALHFAENLGDTLPGLIKPAIQSPTPSIQAVVPAVDFVAPIAAAGMRIVEVARS